MTGLRLGVGLLLAGAMAQAGVPLPPEEDLQVAIESSPAVQMARAGLDEAQAMAQSLRAGPHEWTLRLEGQDRDVRGDRAYTEWYSGLEHGVRWFGKRSLDEAAARLQGPLAEAQAADLVREQRIALLEAWFDCLAADRRAALATAALAEARALDRIASLRHQHGDASRAEADLAAADLAAAEAEQASASALARGGVEALRLMGLGTSCHAMPIDSLPRPSQDGTAPASPAVTVARLKAEESQLAAQRARANQRPDPVVGVRLGSELGGTDRLAMLSVSLPIGGSRRRAETAAAMARARAQELAVQVAVRSEAGRRLQFQTLEAAGRLRVASGEQDVTSRRRALDAQMRAYELGDAELAIVSQARRQTRQAELALELARIDAWRGASLARLFPGNPDQDPGTPAVPQVR